jgi:hypothetical protein
MNRRRCALTASSFTTYRRVRKDVPRRSLSAPTPRLIELDNGWQLTTTRIAGDEVVEVILNGVPANRAELEGYGLSEEILSYKRRWFVVRADAAPVVSDLPAQRRPVRDRTANRESS